MTEERKAKMTAGRLKSMKAQAQKAGVKYEEGITEKELRAAIKAHGTGVKDVTILKPVDNLEAATIASLLARIDQMEKDRKVDTARVQSMVDQGRIKHGMVPADLIGVDDTLDEERCYYCNASTHLLAEKMVNGISTPPPFSSNEKLNILVFKTAYAIPIQGKGGYIEEMRYISMLKVSSRRIADWVAGNPVTSERPHHEFNIRFFQDAKTALTTTTSDTQRLMDAIAGLRTMSQIELQRMAAEKGIPTSHDMRKDELVFPLAKVMADERARQDKLGQVVHGDRMEKELLAATV